MRTEPFGIDVSANQALRTEDGKVVLKHIDWAKAFAPNAPHKVEFVAMRAAISWGYVDPAFAYNWAEVGRYDKPRAAYHVFYPGEDGVRQAAHFANVVKGDWGELPPVADVELDHGVHPLRFQDNLKKYLDELIRLSGRNDLIIYSRASFMDHYVTGGYLPPSWYNRFDWWLAHYLSDQSEHPGPPALPKGVARVKVIIHQTSENKVAGAGQKFGMQSSGIDYNRWIGEMSLPEYLASVRPVPEVKPDMVERQVVIGLVARKMLNLKANVSNLTTGTANAIMEEIREL